jgi:hypothetical protein
MRRRPQADFERLGEIAARQAAEAGKLFAGNIGRYIAEQEFRGEFNLPWSKSSRGGSLRILAEFHGRILE